MQEVVTFIGVDAAADELVAAAHGQPGAVGLPNEAQAVRAWLEGLPAGAQLAVESTGRCHQVLVTQALALGIAVFVLNARDVFFYAKALGTRGKTDRVDAHVIARYLAEHHASLRPFRPPSAQQAEIDRLLGQRWAVVCKRTALRQSLAEGRGADAGLDAAVQQLAQAFEALLEAIDGRIQAVMASCAELRCAQQRLQSIVGIGPQSSAMLASLLERIPFASADALVAYSGLDPRPHDSGRSRGRRRLSKRGQPALRRQMYMAAMSASHTKVLRPLYQQLRERGFKTTEAMVILARKLLRIAFAVWKSGKPFDPALLTAKA